MSTTNTNTNMKIKILIIDDDEDINNLFKIYLEPFIGLKSIYNNNNYL